MTPVKSALAGLAVGLVAYFVAAHAGAIISPRGANDMALIGTESGTNLAPGATEVPKAGTKSGTNLAPGAKTVAPSLAPAHSLAPSPSASVSPHVSSFIPTPVPYTTLAPTTSPTPSRTPTPTPSHSPTPLPTPVPTPTPTPTPVPSITPTPTPSEQPTPTPSPTPAGTSHVVINELAWAGTLASQYGEWVELYNSGSVAADLSGWSLSWVKSDGIAKIFTISSGNVPPNGYFLIERTTASSPDPIIDITSDASGSFASSGLINTFSISQYLGLFDGSGALIDQVAQCFSGQVQIWCAGDNATKASMERLDASQVGSAASNWATFTGLVGIGHDAAQNPILGTPRHQNSVTP